MDLHHVHVELVLDDPGRWTRAARGQVDQGPGQRLADLDPRLRTGRPTEGREAAGQGHAGVEGGVERPGPERWPVGQVDRVVSAAPVRSRHMRSATNGHIGASSRATVTSTSCRVAWALEESAGSASGSVRQKRRRLRRTYQLEMSSTSSAMAVAAGNGSYPSRDSVAVSTVAARRESIHRSSNERSAGTGMAGSAGSNPFSEA